MSSASLRGYRHWGAGHGKSLGANVCPRKVSSWLLLVIGCFCRSSTRQGEGLRLRSSIETMSNCSTINKLPNTEKSRLKKHLLVLTMSHVSQKRKQSLNCTLCFPCSHSSVLLTHQYHKAKEANQNFPESPTSLIGSTDLTHLLWPASYFCVFGRCLSLTHILAPSWQPHSL